MLTKEKTVHWDVVIGGNTVDSVETGYHMEPISAAAEQLYEKYKKECDAQAEKHFGSEEYKAKTTRITAALEEIAKKPESEQTAEDRMKKIELESLQIYTRAKYLEDPATPKVVATYTKPDGTKSVVYNEDLLTLARDARKELLGIPEAVKNLHDYIFYIIRRSGLKLAGVALKFENEDVEGGEKDHGLMMFLSPFRDTTAVDMNVFEGSIRELLDRAIPGIRSKLGIKEEPEIIQGGRFA